MEPIMGLLAALGLPDLRRSVAIEPPAGVVASARTSLEQASRIWLQTHAGVEAVVVQLKAAIRDKFAKDDPNLIAEIERNMNRLDAILAALDIRLAECLKSAHAANDPRARRAELENCKSILVGYFNYVASSRQLIAGIDTNPFGVKSDLKGLLAGSLRQMARVIS